MARVAAVICCVLAFGVTVFGGLTTDPRFITLVDGYQGSLNFNYNPNNPPDTKFPIGWPGGPTSTYSISTNATTWGTMDGLTIQMWFTPKYIANNPGWPYIAPLFYYGVNSQNYIAFTPCDGNIVTNNSLTSGYTCAGYLKIVSGGTVKATVHTDAFFSDSSYHYLTLSLHPTVASSSFLRVYVASWPDYGYLTNTYQYAVGTTWSSWAATGDRTFSIGYVNDAAFQTSFGSFANGSFSGKVDEVRVYNSALDKPTSAVNTFETVDADSGSSLVAYYKFDSDPTPGTSQTVLDSSGYGNDAAFSGPASSGYTTLRLQSSTSSVSIGNIRFFGAPVITTMKRKVPYNGFATGGWFSVRTYTTTNFIANILALPATGLFCQGTLSSPNYACNAWEAGTGSNIQNEPYTFTYVPVRASCGKTETASVTVSDGTTEYGFPATINFTVISPPTNFNAGTYQLNTTGGMLNIAGTGLGLDGLLATGESVVLTPVISTLSPLSCGTPTVSGTGTTLSCNIGVGVGIYDAAVTICGQTYSLPSVLQFYPPYVDTAFGTAQTELIVRGLNFGANRTFDGVNDYVLVGGKPCNVFSVNQTEIHCTITGLNGSSVYSLSVSIGGQVTNTSFTFASCNPPCVHGTCIAKDTCDCGLSGYSGPDCSSALQCKPACKNNGTCVQSSDGTGKLECNCPVGWTGKDCGTSSSKNNNTVIIGAVVGGGGGLILLLGAAVIFLLIKRKNQRRGGKNFIPLEKKDFSKIIYGEQLTQQPDKPFGNPKSFEEFLIEDNLNLAVVISNLTQITEADKVAKAMIVVFQEHNKVLPLLEAFITEEVQSAETPNTLFRSNSMVSKMFKFYSRLLGLPYLYTTIGPEISQLIEQEHGLEVDPEKMEEGEDLDQMRWLLMAESQGILKQILKSSDDCPAQFRTLFAHIKQTVTPKFPANINTTIGGFIFLRFFCPAVSSPEAYGIVEEPPSASARRLLILITKVLQNLSNDVEFGSKEPYMIKMNDFILSNRAKLTKFYDELVKPSSKSPVTIDMPRHIKQVSIQVLMEHVRDNINKVEDAQLKAKLEGMLN